MGTYYAIKLDCFFTRTLLIRQRDDFNRCKVNFDVFQSTNNLNHCISNSLMAPKELMMNLGFLTRGRFHQFGAKYR